MHQREFQEERLVKTQLLWMRTWLNFIEFFPPICLWIIPDALSHKNYESFLSWGNCFYRNPLLLLRLLSRSSNCACYSNADTTEYRATLSGPNTKWWAVLSHFPSLPICLCHLFGLVCVILRWRWKCKQHLVHLSSKLIRLLLIPVQLALFRPCLCPWRICCQAEGTFSPAKGMGDSPKIKEMEDENQDLLWWGTLAEQSRAAICLCSDLSAKMCLVSITNPHLSLPLLSSFLTISCSSPPHPWVVSGVRPQGEWLKDTCLKET